MISESFIYIKQVTLENKELIAKASITIFASSLSQIEKLDHLIRLGSSIIAMLVGILTLIKLGKELLKKNESKKKKD